MTEELRFDQATAPVVDITVDLRDVRAPLFDAGEIYARQPTRYERYVKPVVDWLAALVLTVLLSPVIIACALTVWISMGRPILYRQDRVGRFGETFTLYKFRTMLPDRRNEQEPFAGQDRRRTHKSPNDPRVTKIGAFLRKWSLDELPQFFNVLAGHMSLVGPRPEMIGIVARYEPWQHRRHAVKPGITGPWQISERGDRMLHECTEIEIAYLDQLSLRTDLRILVRTPIVTLTMRSGF